MLASIISFLKVFTIGLLTGLGLFHLLVAAGREKKQKLQNIIFSFLIFSIAVYLIINNNNYIINTFGKSVRNISSITLTGLIGILILLISSYIFKYEENQLDTRQMFYLINFIIYIIVSDLINLVDLIFLKNLYERLKYLCLAYIFIISLFWIIFSLLSSFKGKNNGTTYYNKFLNVIAYVVIIMIFILYPLSYIITPLQIITTSYLGFSVIFLIFSYALSQEFTNEHNELLNLKNNLEHKVTERTEELRQAYHIIEQKDEQKTTAFLNIFHEIKTPLTVIANYLDNHISNIGLTKDLTVIKYNMDKLIKDARNVLDIEKLEKGLIVYVHDVIINLSDRVIRITDMYMDLAQKKQIELEQDIDDHVLIKANPDALDRILSNLLDNAIKYIDNKGKIKVSLKTMDDKIFLVITDTGIGISAAHQKEIFKPYYQIATHKKNIQGIGMGLPIVYHIIQSLKGDISLESKEEEGTTFTVILNRYELKPDETLLSDPEICLQSVNNTFFNNELVEDQDFSKNFNIFLVEDNKDLIYSFQENLGKKYNIHFAINGKDALKKIGQIPCPDIIISDIMMDEMDGFEFYNELRKITAYHKVPLIFLTVKSDNESRFKGLSGGAVDYICKPFLFKEIELKIETLIYHNKRNLEEYIQAEKRRMEYEFNALNKLQQEIYPEPLNEQIFLKNCEKYNISAEEIKVARYWLMDPGKMQKNIAADLYKSEKTISTQTQSIFKKLNVNNQIDAVKKLTEK